MVRSKHSTAHRVRQFLDILDTFKLTRNGEKVGMKIYS